MKVLTFGVFDILHIGHTNLFRNARVFGDYLIVAVQEGESVEKFKPGCHLSEDYETRARKILECGLVDEVVPYSSVGTDIRNMDFDVFVKGPDQIHSGFAEAVKWCRENGKRVVVVLRTEGVSSTEERVCIEK